MKLLRCAEIIMSIFCSKETLTSARLSVKYFTRIRKMPFQDILCYLIAGYKMSTQVVLNEFFNRIGKTIHMTQQALSKARSHFDHTPFSKAFYALVDEEYCEDNLANIKRFYGLMIVAIDGSIIPLPCLPELKAEFGEVNGSPSARASIALDVINDRIIDASLTPLSTDERTLATEHIHTLSEKTQIENTVFVFDRGYPSDELIQYIISKNAKFIMRTRRKFSNLVDSAKMGSSVVTLESGIEIRVIKFYLPSGEIETLITNLFKMPTKRFKKLYHLRWPVETKYDIVKNKLEMPNFTGYSKNVIYQDFWISMLLANVASIAKSEADDVIKLKRFGKENKYEYQANINLVIASLRNRFAEAVFSKNTLARKIRVNKIIHEIAQSAVPVRPGRIVPRKNARGVKFHHNKKSNV